MISRSTQLHTAYLITIIIKGLFGLLEFCSGAIIAIFGPQRLYVLALRVIDLDLYEGGHTHTAQLVLQGAAALSQTRGYFVIFYLFMHGALKMTITAVLLRGRGRWVFPVASAILLGFIAFFGFHLSKHWSIWVLGLALFDTLTLTLVTNEWRNWSKG
ncbi:MAG: DUF2127 domain-containing protein [Alphaproteobacteria bacterium]|nr:DUF2127 domain-containing protein [Alphaproteobacteria bacterium]